MVADDLTGIAQAGQSYARDVLAELHLRAKKLADDYWAEFSDINRSQYNRPSELRQIGRYGPNVQLHPRNEKIYIEWRQYTPTRTGKRQKIYGVRVRPRRGLNYLPAQFVKAYPWELDMIVALEEKFQVLRTMIEIYHGANKGLKRMLQQSKTDDAEVGLSMNEDSDHE